MIEEDACLAEKLKSKNAKIFHAINFYDFGAYCQQRSILARSVLANNIDDYTHFFSDEKDKKLGVWNRCFGNLNDLGQYFWRFENSSPNAYGPITIVLDQKCWDSLADISITKNTITSVNIKNISVEMIDEIFESVNGRYRIKSGFTAAEVSSSNTHIPFENIAYILVDPIIIARKPLREHVIDLLDRENCIDEIITNNQVIERRISCDPQKERIRQLTSWALTLKGKLITQNEPLERSLPAKLEDWFNPLEPWKKHTLASWLTYTYNGTLRWLDED